MSFGVDVAAFAFETSLFRVIRHKCMFIYLKSIYLFIKLLLNDSGIDPTVNEVSQTEGALGTAFASISELLALE